jgi:transposase
MLAEGAPAYGFGGEVWTCARVADVLQGQFGVSYHPAHVWRLLKQVAWTPQKPVRQARQRRWPALKKGRKRGEAPLSS